MDRALRINNIKKGAEEKEPVGGGANEEGRDEGNKATRGKMCVKNWGVTVG